MAKAKVKRLAKSPTEIQPVVMFTRKHIAQGGTNGGVVLQKFITLPSGENGGFYHLPLAAKVVVELTNIPDNDKKAKTTASMRILSDHVCDEHGTLLYEDEIDAGEIPVETVPVMAGAMMGKSENPTVTDQ